MTLRARRTGPLSSENVSVPPALLVFSLLALIGIVPYLKKSHLFASMGCVDSKADAIPTHEPTARPNFCRAQHPCSASVLYPSASKVRPSAEALKFPTFTDDADTDDAVSAARAAPPREASAAE